ncbi:MAG: hypothetical protein ABSD78_19700 [Acidimicrobiales bacterium]
MRHRVVEEGGHGPISLLGGVLVDERRRGLAWPMRAINSFVVIPGMRAIVVAAWWRRSWMRRPTVPTRAHAARHAAERVARRSGPPPGPVNTTPPGPGAEKRSMCWRSDSVTAIGSTTVRVPASLLGSVVMRPRSVIS